MAHPTVLLVDGYNIVGAWPRLVKLRDRHGLEAARTELIEIMIDYSAYRAHRTVLVFDAQLVTTPLVREEQTPNLEICFTAFEQTADTFIEQYSYQLLRTGSARVMVATSDRAQQQLILAQGADWLSAESLWQEVKRAREQMRDGLKQRRPPGGGTLGDRLDPKIRERFSQWRYGEGS